MLKDILFLQLGKATEKVVFLKAAVLEKMEQNPKEAGIYSLLIEKTESGAAYSLEEWQQMSVANLIKEISKMKKLKRDIQSICVLSLKECAN